MVSGRCDRRRAGRRPRRSGSAGEAGARPAGGGTRHRHPLDDGARLALDCKGFRAAAQTEQDAEIPVVAHYGHGDPIADRSLARAVPDRAVNPQLASLRRDRLGGVRAAERMHRGGFFRRRGRSRDGYLSLLDRVATEGGEDGGEDAGSDGEVVVHNVCKFAPPRTAACIENQIAKNTTAPAALSDLRRQYQPAKTKNKNKESIEYEDTMPMNDSEYFGIFW